MSIDLASLQVQHKPENNRFEINLDGHTAVLEYFLSGSTITFTHTGVPSALEGQGIGAKLARAGLDHARASGYKVVPLCSFISSYIQRKPEYQDLL